MRTERQIDPRHDQLRSVLRALGVLLTAAGGILAAVGFLSFFAAFTSGFSPGAFQTSGPPRGIFLAFVGIPLLGIGMALLRYAFLGAAVRYIADEVAPVGKDTFNYLAEGTRDGVRTLAEALGEGMAAGGAAEAGARVLTCASCGTANSREARFCSACGEPLIKSKRCAECQEPNDPDAGFCDRCGTRFPESP